jgi:hypothetical protein
MTISLRVRILAHVIRIPTITELNLAKSGRSTAIFDEDVIRFDIYRRDERLASKNPKVGPIDRTSVYTASLMEYL